MTVKQLERESKINDRYKRYRRMAIPKFDFYKHVKRPFTSEFTQGNFMYDMYFSVSPIFMIWVYARNIIPAIIPALLLHIILYSTDQFVMNTLGDDGTVPGATPIVILFYIVGLYFGIRKAKDHAAYYTIELVHNLHDINQAYLRFIYRYPNIENQKEAKVMEHYRLKYNKYSLFPSIRELALVEQLYQKGRNSHKESVRENVTERRGKLNLMNKKEEHIAAKKIADWKQTQYGGENEYDKFVNKYEKRTVPAIRNIIKEVKK